MDPWRQAPYQMGGKFGPAGSLGPKVGPVRVIRVGSLGAKPAPSPPRGRVGAGWIRVDPPRSAQYSLLKKYIRY